jgi:hypothetical protein
MMRGMKFSLRQLFVSVFLIGTGISMFFMRFPSPLHTSAAVLTLAYLASAMVGAGLFLFYKRPFVGAAVGAVFGMLFLLIVYCAFGT